MATLQKKTVVVVGGSSGIGFGVALAALQSLASVVIIASSNRIRVDEAVERLKGYKLSGEVRGEVLDAKDSAAVKAFSIGLGTVDHIVWTSGDVPSGHAGGTPYSTVQSPEEGQGKSYYHNGSKHSKISVYHSCVCRPILGSIYSCKTCKVPSRRIFDTNIG